MWAHALPVIEIYLIHDTWPDIVFRTLSSPSSAVVSFYKDFQDPKNPWLLFTVVFEAEVIIGNYSWEFIEQNNANTLQKV